MNPFAIFFLLVNAVALLTLSRRWAALPLLMGACYMTGAQRIDVGPFHFTVLRLLLLVAAIRTVARRERLPGGLIGMDRLMLLWGAWLLFSSAFHESFSQALVFRLGAAYNALGFYFLIRIFCQSTEDLIQLIKVIALVLVPVSLEMVSEKFTGWNLFAIFGGVPEAPQVRDGALRAQGPFGHSILAGTVGAMCIPLIVGIWRQHAKAAKIGLVACLGMVIASKSSGPLMGVVLSVFALAMWRWRHLTRRMRIAAVFGYMFLSFIPSERAAYYAILCRIDLTGSSTGWHRAELISQSIEHLSEWWFAGTDYTRHWMPYGVSADPNMCDITNHYLFYGVWGGLPLMLLFIAALWVAFRYVGQSLRLRVEAPFAEQFLIWSVGAGLFAHAVTCISVAYYEQSVMFLYLNLAVIGSLRAVIVANARAENTWDSDCALSTGEADGGNDATIGCEIDADVYNKTERKVRENSELGIR